MNINACEYVYIYKCIYIYMYICICAHAGPARDERACIVCMFSQCRLILCICYIKRVCVCVCVGDTYIYIYIYNTCIHTYVYTRELAKYVGFFDHD